MHKQDSGFGSGYKRVSLDNESFRFSTVKASVGPKVIRKSFVQDIMQS